MTGEAAGVLRVEVLAARNLPPAVLGSLLKWTPSYSNPYVVASLRGARFVSRVVERELNPTWKETGSLPVPLPTEQDVLQTVGFPDGGGKRRVDDQTKAKGKKGVDSSPPVSSSSIHSFTSDGDAVDGMDYHPCAPELLVEVFHRADDAKPASPSAAGSSDVHNDVEVLDKRIGAVVAPLLPCLLSASSSHRAWYSLIDTDEDSMAGPQRDAGQIQLSLNFDAGSDKSDDALEPRRGDIIRLAGFGGAEYYSKLLSPTARLEVMDVFQDQILAQCKSREGWTLSFELHRNLVHVEKRPSRIRDATSTLQGQMIRARHSRAFAAGEKLWRALPDMQRDQLARSYAFATFSTSQVAGALATSANRTMTMGFGAGAAALLAGTTTACSNVQQEFARVYWSAVFDDVGGSHKARGRIVSAFTPADRLALEGQEDYHDEEEFEVDRELGDTEDDDEEDMDENVDVPEQLLCPITGCAMQDPVVAADGHTYERAAILQWFATSDKSPLTGARMPTTQVFPNITLRQLSEEVQARRHRRQA